MKNFVLIVVLFFLGCSSDVDGSKVSVEQVLTNADNYLNKKVTVYGFLASGVGLRIFPSKEYADFGGALSIAVLDPTLEGDLTISCEEKYVEINAVLEFFSEQYNLVYISDVSVIDEGFCWSSANYIKE